MFELSPNNEGGLACLFLLQISKGDRYSLSILEQEWDSLQVKHFHSAAN